jgi:N-acetylmuramoyl-L-alanine amidase
VKRLGGADRFGTAAKVAEELRAKAGAPLRVVVATCSGFADALSAAPLAAAKGWPILLTKPAALPTVTAEAVKASGATASLIVGSEQSVSPAVSAALPAPFRAGGGDRYATCALVADFARQQGCGYGRIAIATGVTFPDALAAGPMLAPDAGLVLLASRTELPAALRTRLAANRAAVTEVHVLGKPVSVPPVAIAGVEASLR